MREFCGKMSQNQYIYLLLAFLTAFEGAFLTDVFAGLLCGLTDVDVDLVEFAALTDFEAGFEEDVFLAGALLVFVFGSSKIISTGCFFVEVVFFAAGFLADFCVDVVSAVE